MADREGDKLASYRVGKEETGPTVTETDGRCKFVSLHHHTTYSYMDGFGTTEQHSEAAAQRGQTALAVTEHGNVSSHPTHARRCEERGVKPLFGCELYTGYPDVAKKTEKNPLGIQTKKNHLTVIAGDNTGYRNLLELVSLSWRDGFARFPTSLPDMIDDHADGLIVLSGCTASELACSLVGGKETDPAEASYARAKKVARRMKKQFGDRFFLEVQMLPELDEVRAINQAYQELSRELRIPLVGTADVHYPDPDDGEMRRILHAVGRGGRDVDEVGQEWDYSVDSSLPLSDRAVLRRLMATGLDKKAARSALGNTARIADMANVELPRMPMVEFPVEDGYEDSEEMYWAWLDEGWHKRGFNRLSRRDQIRYRRRIKYESGLIAGKGFVDYFLIVADMCKFAKGSGIPVGPARGSAAASLVCYLLDITEVNPMDFPHLVFERFIDATRKDLPDIDLDFDDELRVEVFNYMTRKYGPEYTGMIGTFTFYKSKNSLDDVARVNGIPPWEVDKVKDVMIERSSGDLRASATIEDTIEYFDQAREVFENHPALGAAMKLEGNVKGMGVHSAGLVIAPEPLTNVCAVYTRQGKTDRSEVISMDKYSAEEMGMLKIDVLGLSTMGMLRVATELLGWSLQDLYDIPLDDPETIEGFRENDVVGIFQFDGWAMRLVNQELKPDNFTEVCDVNALARPGPLHNGASSEYIDIKMGNKEPRRYHPLVDDITRHTNYQIVYQEQILRIVMEVGKFEWTHAAYIRKIISKKIGEQEFARQGDTFLKGAVENGLEESVAKEVWGDLITAGSYAFNSAHCQPGDAVVRRGGRPEDDFTLEQLWRIQEMHGSLGTGGGDSARGTSRKPKRCMACDEPADTVAGQCPRCRHKRHRMEDRKFYGLSLGEDGRVIRNVIERVFNNGRQQLWRLEMSDGSSVRATGDHRFWTPVGWKTVDELEPGAAISRMSDGYTQHRTHRYGPNANAMKRQSDKTCEECGSDKWIDVVHVDGDPSNDSIDNLKHLCRGCHTSLDGPNIPWSRGRDTEIVAVVSKEKDGIEDVYTLQMSGEVGHNYVTDEGWISKNCVAYGMLAWWCMYIKRHHPLEFFTAALRKLPDGKKLALLKDAVRHDIAIEPPDPVLSERTWQMDEDEGSILAGFEQIPGIGEATAEAILETRERAEKDGEPWTGWSRLIDVKGIGPKSLEKCMEFVEQDDPFEIHLLTRRLRAVKDAILSDDLPCPMPTHTSLEVPYARTGKDMKVVWAGEVLERNLRDLFEVNLSRTGIPLDPDEVKAPDKAEWLIMRARDDEEQMMLTIDRWKYPRMKAQAWSIRPEHDIVIVKGTKRGNQSARRIYIEKMWVVDPEG